MQDWRLLREYVEDGSQTAFASLVDYHLNFVYSTCLREVGDPALAEDVTQVVFLLLSRKAGTLREGTVLAGWLFNTARFASKNALRQETRRQRREQKAAEEMMRELQPRDATWKDLEPLLHDALAALSAPERNIVFLRFFEGRSLRHAGEALGISEDAARMRATRALEKLRHYFSRHGYAVPVMVLAGLLSTQAVSAAPAACAGVTALLVPSAASATATAGYTGATAGCTGAKVLMLAAEVRKALVLSQIKFAASVVAGTTVVALGAGSMGHLAMSRARTEAQAARTPVVRTVMIPRRSSPAGRPPAAPAAANNHRDNEPFPRRRPAQRTALSPTVRARRDQFRTSVTSRAHSRAEWARVLTQTPKSTMRVNSQYKRSKVMNVRKNGILQVKQTVVPVVLVAMMPVSAGVAPAQAAPPPWAPAKGYRTRQAHGRQKPAKDQVAKNQDAQEQIRGDEADRVPAGEEKGAQAGPPPWAPAHGYRAKQGAPDAGGQLLDRYPDQDADERAAPGEGRGGPPPWAPAHGYRAKQGAPAGDNQDDQEPNGAGEKRGGPPAWAPAWGRRGRHPHGKR